MDLLQLFETARWDSKAQPLYAKAFHIFMRDKT